MFRVAVAYAVAAWLVVQVTATVTPAFGLPPAMLQAVVVLSVLGLLPALAFAWSYDLTPLGLQRAAPPAEPTADELEVGRRTKRALTRFTIAAAVLAVLATGTAVALRSAGVGPLAPGRASLAVLPFADLSPGRDQAYFAEGVAEEILTLLADDPGIRVVGRTSAAQFKDRAADMAAIRAALDVSHVLEGSVRTQGERLRMNVRLVRTSDGDQVWAETYDRDLADVFAVQDEIGKVVAARLKGTLDRRASKERRADPSVDAYALLLQARAKMRLRQEAPIEEARALLRRAIALEPDYAPALAAYAEATILLADDSSYHGRIPFKLAREQALPYARRAIRLAPNRADGYAALGYVLSPRPEAIAPLQRAAALDPARGEILQWLSITYRDDGRHAEALEQARAAYALEPLWPTAVRNLVWYLAASGRHDEAEAVVAQFERHARRPAAALGFRSVLARERGDVSETIRYAEAAWRLDPAADNTLAHAYNAVGLNAEVDRLYPAGRHAMRSMVLSGDRAGVLEAARTAGPRLWNASGLTFAAQVLAAERAWPELLRLYDGRDQTVNQICRQDGPPVLPFALALRTAGRGAEALALLDCRETFIQGEKAVGVFNWGGERVRDFELAQIRILRGDSAGGLTSLEAAIAGGWRGHDWIASANLADYPAFDAIRSHPRFLAADARLRAEQARERREVLAARQPSQATRSPP